MTKLAFHFSPHPATRGSTPDIDQTSCGFQRIGSDNWMGSTRVSGEDTIQYTKRGDIKYIRDVSSLKSDAISDLYDSATSTVSCMVPKSGTYYLSLIVCGDNIGMLYISIEDEISEFAEEISSGQISYTELSNRSAKLSLCDWSPVTNTSDSCDRKETQAD